MNIGSKIKFTFMDKEREGTIKTSLILVLQLKKHNIGVIL